MVNISELDLHNLSEIRNLFSYLTGFSSDFVVFNKLYPTIECGECVISIPLQDTLTINSVEYVIFTWNL